MLEVLKGGLPYPVLVEAWIEGFWIDHAKLKIAMGDWLLLAAINSDI